MNHDEHAAARAKAQRAMAEQDLTARDLASRAAVARNTIGFMLSGQSWPRKDTLRKIEKALGLPLNALDDAEDPTLNRSPDSTVTGDVAAQSIVLHFPPGALDDLSESQTDELLAALRAEAWRRMREIRGPEPQQ